MENRDALLGELKGSLQGLKEAVEGMNRDNRSWQQTHQTSDNQAFSEIKSLIKDHIGALKNSTDEQLTDLERMVASHGDDIADLRETRDQETGRARADEKHANLFRWIISTIVGVLGLLLGQHIYMTSVLKP